MIDALYIAENALRANQEWIGGISHNVANMNTPGYKRTDIQFVDMVKRTEGNSKSLGHGTHIDRSKMDFRLGQMLQTNNQLHVAIDGQGFFEVLLENGETAYTRVGILNVGDDGLLKFADGAEMADTIHIPESYSNLTITPDGEVQVSIDNGSTTLSVGQLNLAIFQNPHALEAIGGGLFKPNASSGEARVAAPGDQSSGYVRQGIIEMSNVELVQEMSDIMLAQRSYQLNARLLQISDQVLETINNLRR